ncbi:MAG TPA: ABC transporter ATP-binding protein, partial [Terriglobia bacterium]|nr:ABC transporter ATP-binding protein [Terriglobia bacterium]
GASSGYLVEARSLSKVYETPASRVTVFEGLSWVVPRGRLLAVIGPSGAGKSTLLHLLGGLDRPTSGSVWVDGTDVFSLDPLGLAGFRNRRIGFIFQFHHLLPEFTVLENAMMPGMIRGAPREETGAAARQILERVGLGPRLTHKVGEISGGEQQRVAIARALSGGPQLLLADEPTGNLDQKTGESVFSMIRELHAERGLTSILVTHNEKLAAQCDEVWEMEAGRLQNPNCSQ